MYYVYVHVRLSDDKVFYIGKGCKNRLWSREGRNNHWHNTVIKHGYKAIIVQKFSTDEEACLFETEFIAYVGIGNLVNRTVDSRGHGRVLDNVSKLKMSEVQKQRFNADRHFHKNMYDKFNEKYPQGSEERKLIQEKAASALKLTLSKMTPEQKKARMEKALAARDFTKRRKKEDVVLHDAHVKRWNRKNGDEKRVTSIDFKKIAAKYKKPIMAINLTTGERLNFDGICDASKILGIRDSIIIRVLTKKRKTANGMIFVYL